MIRNREIRKEFAKTVKDFENEHGLTKNDMKNLFWEELSKLNVNKESYHDHQETNKHNQEIWDGLDDNQKKLWELFKTLEGEVVSFLVDNPDILLEIKDIEKKETNRMSVPDKFIAPINFTMSFDDVLDTLKGRNFNGDMYIGFKIGDKFLDLQ